MNYKAILFDFDYTLGDSTNGIVLSANYALVKLGYAQKSVEDIRKTIGLSLKDTYFALTGSKKEETLNFYKKAGYNSEDKTAFIQWL